jgi:mannose-6-phosphate isomerase-like protein (cupin superfamily)
MKCFSDIVEVHGIVEEHCHHGEGWVLFRRLLDQSAFEGMVDFVDFTVIPPGSTIGAHEHHGNEEMYLIVSGRPLMTVNGESRRLARGAVAVVHSGQGHQLANDTAEDIEIFVVQARLPGELPHAERQLERTNGDGNTGH